MGYLDLLVLLCLAIATEKSGSVLSTSSTFFLCEVHGRVGAAHQGLGASAISIKALDCLIELLEVLAGYGYESVMIDSVHVADEQREELAEL